MKKYNKERTDFYKLSKHSYIQSFSFIILFLILTLCSYFLLLTGAEYSIKVVSAVAINKSDSSVNKIIDRKNSDKIQINYFTKWAIDIGEKDNQTRYWLNPTIAIAVPSLLMGILLTLLFSTILPGSAGYMRQKIEREIMFQLDKLHYKRYGIYSNDLFTSISDEIVNADLRKLHDLSKEYEMYFDEINSIRKAILWRNDNAFKAIISSINAIVFYMKFYFTEKYNNIVMGMVYIGAAVLIIIIGMRGLKFIPSTEPTLVIFALGLEFSLLLTYAFTLMFSKQESDQDANSFQNSNNSILSAHDLDNAAEIENLLRMFISDTENKSVNKIND